jgi:Holliday junction resolvase RusA-like endonuclease
VRQEAQPVKTFSIGAPSCVELEIDDGPEPVIVELRLPLPPSKNDYWRSAPGRGLVLTHAALAYKAAIAMQAARERWRALTGPISILRCEVHLPGGGDLSNRLMALEDALNCHAWLDDAQIGSYDRLVRIEHSHTPGVLLVLKGERLATADELRAYRAKKALTNQKRKASVAKTRKKKNAEKVDSLRNRLLQRAQAAHYPAVKR